MGNKVRIGNDVTLRWSIYRQEGGERVPYEVEGRLLHLYIEGWLQQRIEIAKYDVAGHVVTLVYRGRDQVQCGAYRLVLEEERDGVRSVIDSCVAVELVAHSCEADVEGSGAVSVESVVPHLRGDAVKVRIGNDVAVTWGLYTEAGEVYEPAGPVRVWIEGPLGDKVVVSEYVVEGHEVRLVYRGRHQRYAGVYRIVMVENGGMDGMHTVDVEAFDLVAHSCDSSLPEDVELTSVRLQSVVSVGGGGGASTWDELEGKPENLVVAEATDEEVEEADGVPNVKYVAQSLTAEQQKQARENIGGAEATPSGDPMHYAYVSAGAIWDGESWQADQRKGLTNEQVRKLFIKEDMSEMLFRKMWNMAGGRIPYCPGYYDEATGFYRVNGVWHMTYEEALEVYVVTHNNNDSLWGTSLQRPVIVPITTMPFVGNRARPGFPCIVWAQRIVEHRTELYTHNMGNGTWYDTQYSDFTLGYCPNLRTMRDTYNLYGRSGYTTIDLGRMSSFLHCNFRIDRSLNPLTYTFERLSYYSLHYSLSNTRYASTIKLHPTVYGFVTGTINPEELSKEPMRPENADYDLIPYQQNLKVVPDNAFWREELDVKGINGEYVYPSFAEYLTNNPSNFATAEEWQALATLAQEKNVTLTQT